MLVVKMASPSLGLNEACTAESVGKHLQEIVEGEVGIMDAERLGDLVDIEKVRRIYKLGTSDQGAKARRRKDGSLEGRRSAKDVARSGMAEGAEQSAMQEVQDEREELEMQVLGLMALRGAT